LLYTGLLTNHAFLVKFVGAGVLAILCLVTITFARGGWGPLILRTWVSGMAFWGLIAWVDWKVVNIIPFLEAKTESRFGGMQFDPNNAGAAFALAVVVMWRYGHRLYPSRPVRWIIGLSFIFFLGETLSRGGFVGLAAAIAVLLVVTQVSAARWVRYVAVAMIVVGGAVATGYVGNAIDDFERRPDNVGDRSFKLSDSIEQYVDTGGLGIGLGTYRNEQQGEVVHNTAVWLLTEMSLAGVFFVVAITAVPAHAALRLRSVDREFALALLGGHIVMLVTSVGIEALYQRHWWLIIGLITQPLYGRLRPAT
jgi:putative inorganic carbon (HCO3(-)) transporter